MTESTNWHRLFGLILMDFFTDSPFEVLSEKDLSLHQQRLDILILRKRPGGFAERLPDGLEDLAEHNLPTFKSHRQALDDWALKELTGHYVNYRKQANEGKEPLLPESDFRLYAVCSRFPHNLNADVKLEPVSPGVYECRRGTDVFRILVAGQLPEEEQNAMVHLFSAAEKKVVYGAAHYHRRTKAISSLLDQLFEDYQTEGITMPYTMEEFGRDYAKKNLKKLTTEERLEGLPPEERLRGLSPEELARALPPEILEALKQQIPPK